MICPVAGNQLFAAEASRQAVAVKVDAARERLASERTFLAFIRHAHTEENRAPFAVGHLYEVGVSERLERRTASPVFDGQDRIPRDMSVRPCHAIGDKGDFHVSPCGSALRMQEQILSADFVKEGTFRESGTFAESVGKDVPVSEQTPGFEVYALHPYLAVSAPLLL